MMESCSEGCSVRRPPSLPRTSPTSSAPACRCRPWPVACSRTRLSSVPERSTRSRMMGNCCRGGFASPLRGAPSSAVFDDWYVRNRARTRDLFEVVADEAYYSRPIDLRHPIVFYEGHLPAFSFNTLVKRALGEPGIDARLETLFARGIDPAEDQAGRSNGHAWPDRH